MVEQVSMINEVDRDQPTLNLLPTTVILGVVAARLRRPISDDRGCIGCVQITREGCIKEDHFRT